MARGFKFTAKSYTSSTDPDGDIHGGDVYDVDSVMHYHSAQSKRVDVSEDGRTFCREIIDHNLQPSIKTFYPWQG